MYSWTGCTLLNHCYIFAKMNERFSLSVVKHTSAPTVRARHWGHVYHLQLDWFTHHFLSLCFLTAEIDPELWCSDRDTSQYPLSLSPPLPPDRTIPPIRTTKTSSAETSHGIHLLSMVATFMLAMFMSFRYNK